MAYNQYSFDSLTGQIGVLLDDELHKYWLVSEIHYALSEALYVWGGLTNYWRARDSFSISPADSSPFYDLNQLLPTLRPRTTTLNQIVEQVQLACLEAPSFAGTNSSGQISINSIRQSIQRARNRVAVDFKFPYNVSTNPIALPSSDGFVEVSESATYVHRAAWHDNWSGRWSTLLRSDAWSIDRTTSASDSTLPAVYSESQLAPLVLQLSPPPVNPGTLEMLIVRSELIDPDNPAVVFNFPDEWAYALKWAALSDIFGGQSQNFDPLRGKYAEMRYTQAVDFARDARSVTRLTLNGNMLPMGSLYSIDLAAPYRRNQRQMPGAAGCLYDMVAFDCLPKTAYGVGCDVIRAAPIPADTAAPVQIGSEDITSILDYTTHILTFKCGGSEFTASFDQYDSFMQSVGGRGQINKAKIRYLNALLGQPQSESAERPDKLEVARA